MALFDSYTLVVEASRARKLVEFTLSASLKMNLWIIDKAVKTVPTDGWPKWINRADYKIFPP